MKKILSAILAIVLVLSMVPAVVTAEAGTHSADHVCEKCGASATWTAWTSKTTLPTSGHYYLTGDVTVSNQTVASNLCLCLNGYTTVPRITRPLRLPPRTSTLPLWTALPLR